MASPPGLDVVEQFRNRIYEHWMLIRARCIQSGHKEWAEDLVAVIYQEGTEQKLVMGPRIEILAAMVQDGADFSGISQLDKPAREGTPLPSRALWVLVMVDDSIAVTRLVEPLVSTAGTT